MDKRCGLDCLSVDGSVFFFDTMQFNWIDFAA